MRIKTKCFLIIFETTKLDLIDLKYLGVRCYFKSLNKEKPQLIYILLEQVPKC